MTQIQKAWKLRTQGDIHALSQGILKFRRRINDLLQASLVPENTEQFEKENIARQEERDDLLGIGRVVRLQRERLERMMKEERELGVKHANLSRDIQSLAALSKVFVKEKEFAIKHAIDPVKERKDEIRSQRIDANFNAFMSNTSEEGRERMIRVADRFLQAVLENTIPVTVVYDKNGDIRYIPEQQGSPEEDCTD